jgi:hypothetical protein
MFEAISGGSASIVTGEIDAFTETGIRLKDGRALEADIVVTATGLKLQLAGDIAFAVDGEARDLAKTLSYRGMMFSDMPNLSYSFGYTNASWTLKADLTGEYLCRRSTIGEDPGRRSPSPSASRRRGGSLPRLLLGLRAAGAGCPAQAGLEEALEAPPELRARHVSLRYASVQDEVIRFLPRGAAAPARPAREREAA